MEDSAPAFLTCWFAAHGSDAPVAGSTAPSP